MSKEGREIYDRQRAAQIARQDELVRRDQQAALDKHMAVADPNDKHDTKKSRTLKGRVADAKAGRNTERSNGSGWSCGFIIMVGGIGAAVVAGTLLLSGGNAEATPQQMPVSEPILEQPVHGDLSIGLNEAMASAVRHITLSIVSIEDTPLPPGQPVR